MTKVEKTILMTQAVILTGLAALLEGKTLENNALAKRMEDLAKDISKQVMQ